MDQNPERKGVENMSMGEAIQIGINKLTSVQKMAHLIKMADTKKDILYILEKMENELSEGIAEIDQIEKNNRSENNENR